MPNDLNGPEKVILKNGYAFKVIQDGRLYHNQLFWDVVQSNQWEPETFALIERHCSAEHTFIDLGAWIGPTTLFAACIAKHVYAVEPDPAAVKILQGNMALNDGFSNKITIFQGCISDLTGMATLGNRKEFGNSESSLLFRDNVRQHQVPSLVFSDFIRRFAIEQCSLIKMDVEGAEILILPTMIEFLNECKPDLLVSFHKPIYGERAADVMEIMFDILKNVYPYIYTTDGQTVGNIATVQEPLFDLFATCSVW